MKLRPLFLAVLTAMVLPACATSTEPTTTAPEPAATAMTPSSMTAPSAPAMVEPTPSAMAAPTAMSQRPADTVDGEQAQRFQRAGGTKARPLAVGQWARYAKHHPNGTDDLLEYRVTGEERDAHWLEFSFRLADGRASTIALLLKLKETSGALQPTEEGDIRFEVIGAKMQGPNGQTQVVPSRILATSRRVYAPLLASIETNFGDAEAHEDVTVPAGQFEGAARSQRSVSMGPGGETRLVVWDHAAVPITGLVKGQETDGTGAMELIAFGMTGAESAFH